MRTRLSAITSVQLLSGILFTLGFALLIIPHFTTPTHAPFTLLALYDPTTNSSRPLPEDQTIARGELLSTNDHEWKKFEVTIDNQTTDIYLAERTSLKVTDTSSYPPTLTVIEGRVVTNGDATLAIRDSRFPVNGITAFTFYSWMDKLDVAPLKPLGNGQTFDTLPPFDDPAVLIFNPETSSDHAFYSWVLQN